MEGGREAQGPVPESVWRAKSMFSGKEARCKMWRIRVRVTKVSPRAAPVDLG